MATAAQEPLGTLLVKRGLISEEQLAVALADRKETGEPLGKIVVDRGFTRHEMIAQALATEHGGLLKTEYGFATGFGAGLAPTAPVAAASVTAGAIATAPAEAPLAVASPPAELRNELAHASEEAERLRTENERLAQLGRELEQRLAKESQKLAALQAELVAKVEASSAPEPDRWAGAERHLLFFQGAEGYELVERAGAPPRNGDVVQVPGGAMTVARLAASPMPGAKLPCAYLAA